MAIVVDASNVVSSHETAPDKLRAEIGTYFSPEQERSPTAQMPSQFINFKTKLAKSHIEVVESNTQTLIPTKRARVYFTGEERMFRDHIQWGEYVNSIAKDGASFQDHQFDFYSQPIQNSFRKIYHHPEYEDFTKNFPSNLLLNWNLISYPYKDKRPSVQKIADIKTTFDTASGFQITNKSTLHTAMEQFSNRVANYDGLKNEISTKQRNIFDLQTLKRVETSLGSQARNQGSAPLIDASLFPFYYQKNLPLIGTNQRYSQFKKILDDHGKTKNLFQSIKQDLTFAEKSFRIIGENKSVRLYDFISLMTSTRIVDLIEQSDETFLLPEEEVYYDHVSSRFINQVSTVRFLSEMRKFIHSNSRSLKEIYNSMPSKSFFLGYKIEKFLDNDATQPIQTYYTNDANFFDTQLKYGRKYIYKTKVLLGVLGSSYTYSKLFYTINDFDLQSPTGEMAKLMPSEFSKIMDYKYKAYIDVDVSPSFQILEYEVDVDEVAFVDSPTLPPQVEFWNSKTEPFINFRFSPNFFKIESVSNETNEELMRDLNPLTDSDRRISNLLSISKSNQVNPDYFTGIYEVYRLSKPPSSESDFADAFLTTIDDKSSYSFLSNGVAFPEIELDNMNGFFSDHVSTNQKFYYAFRALTYHGTPSNLTIPYEIELLRDSDEFKINVKQYKYPVNKNYSYSKMAKRIAKITPNIERLIFSEENKNNFVLDEGSLLSIGSTKTFKIRVTSKHTGKKIDLNINFNLSKDDSFE